MNPPMDDVEELEASAEATQMDLESLYTANVRTVYNYARARLGATEGEDVTAEVFVAAAAEIERNGLERVTTAWLMAVAHNKVIDRWRRARTRRSKWPALVSASPLTQPDETDRVAQNPTREAVLDALDRLVPRQRAVLVLHHVDGFSAPAVAEQLGLSTAAVESLLARARRTFRAHYCEPVDEP